MRPLHYIPDDQVMGARIGGTVPRGLESEASDDLVQYFGTFPVIACPEIEFSMFHRFDIFGDDATRDVLDHNNRILSPFELLWVVVHGPSERGDMAARPFEARGLTIDAESPDEVVDDDGTVMPYNESKLGGVCFLERYWLQDAVSAIETDGYRLLLTIGMHGSDLIDGFPWDPGCLHVWARKPDQADTYRFLVEQ
jgi:hypothetical protein